MLDGFDITFREVLPEPGILELVLEQLANVRSASERHCSVILRRTEAENSSFGARVELAPLRRGPTLHGEGSGEDPYAALYRAFAALQHRLDH